MTSAAFPLKLYVVVRDYPAALIAKPILSDELKTWFTEVGITDFALEWRPIDESHPYFNDMPKTNHSVARDRCRTTVDTWVVFANKSDAALFKLTWGYYEGC